MNIHHRCHDVTVEPGRPSPMSLFRGAAQATLYGAHRTICMLPPSLHKFSSREGGLFGLPLRASNEHIPIVRVPRAQETNRPPSHSSSFPHFALRGAAGLSFTARIGRYVCSLQACLFSLKGWGLTDLPLRASNEGLLRPRVARAQKIIRLHPLLCSANKKDGPAAPLPS